MAATRSAAQASTIGDRRMFRTAIDIPEQNRQRLIQMLNQELADLTDLYQQMKHAHWNVKGPQFFQLHKLYDEIALELLQELDLIAERITALGGFAKGTLKMAAGSTRLEEFPEDALMDLRSIEALIQVCSQVAQTVREGIDFAEENKDQGTVDLLSGTVLELDKSLWMLQAHLQGSNGAGGRGR
jgi:starvation-inducible DNA-binding protein